MSIGQLDDAAFTQELRKLPYDKRWDLLKPKLEGLFYTTEVEHICRLLKDRWAFEATPRQCKYRFKSWGWKKSIPEKVKHDLSIKALKRAAKGKDTVALYHGQVVPPHRLHRTLNTATSRQPSTNTMFSLSSNHFASLEGYLPFGDRLLVNWRIPYGTRPIDPTSVWSYGSPVSSIQTPGNVEIQTPQAMNGLSPGVVTHWQRDASLSSVVRQQRSKMLVEGRWHDLLRTLSQTEQMSLSTWFHQFYNFAFIAAQSWNRDPSSRFAQPPVSVGQSLATVDSPNNNLSTASTPRVYLRSAEALMPPQQCRWSIHIGPDACFYPLDDEGNDDFNTTGQIRPLHDQLLESLQSNDFSNIPEDQLPLPIPEIMRHITPDPSELVLESVAFAIMGRNVDLLLQSLRTARERKIDVAPVYPFHLAAAFLDGATSCCLVFDTLLKSHIGTAASKDRLTNEYGHTVLDAFLLTILRSHTTVTMKDVDETLAENATIPGQEVDVCGRWSTESPCYEAFVLSGRTTLPESWKHKFCHTSVQVVLHSASMLLGRLPTLQSLPSGLFTHQCFGCGRRLHMGPLHAVVMTAFTLATSGSAGEDLFGVVAYYLLLVVSRLPPLARSKICISQLLGTNLETECSHEAMTSHEMTVAMGSEIQRLTLTETARTGWNLLIMVTRLVEEAVAKDDDSSQGSDDSIDSPSATSRSIDASVSAADDMADIDHQSKHTVLWDSPFLGYCDESCYGYDESSAVFGQSPLLGHIWAAFQAELANYRRLEEGDGWLSESFSMTTLLASLMDANSPETGYIRRSMLQPYCKCGRFEGSALKFALNEDIFKEYSANIDGCAAAWARTSFLEMPSDNIYH